MFGQVGLKRESRMLTTTTARWLRYKGEGSFCSLFWTSSEKGGANWPLCLVIPKGGIERVKAKRPVCPTLAARFSFRQRVAALGRGIRAPTLPRSIQNSHHLIAHERI